MLVKPPFRFLLDVIADVRKNTGYGKDVYSDSDLNPSSYKDKDAKTKFLAKIVAKVEKDTGKAPAKASDLVNGDSAKTCEFLILFAKTAHKSKRTSQSSGASRSSTGSKKSSGSSKKHRSSSPKKSSSKGIPARAGPLLPILPHLAYMPSPSPLSLVQLNPVSSPAHPLSLLYLCISSPQRSASLLESLPQILGGQDCFLRSSLPWNTHTYMLLLVSRLPLSTLSYPL